MANELNLINQPDITNRAYMQFVSKLSTDIKLSAMQAIEAHITPGREMEKSDKISNLIIRYYGEEFKKAERMRDHLFGPRVLTPRLKDYVTINNIDLKSRKSVIEKVYSENRQEKEFYAASYAFAQQIFGTGPGYANAAAIIEGLREQYASDNATVYSKLRFMLRDVYCVDETNPEWGEDEIKLGAVTIDADGEKDRIPGFKVMDFNEGDPDKIRKTYDNKCLKEFPIAGGPDTFPKGYAVYVCLAETDGGGFGEFLWELYDAVEEYVVEILVSAGALAGAAIGAEIGCFGGPIGALVGAIIGALIGAIIGWLIDLIKDDIFRPQLAAIGLSSATADFYGSTVSSRKYLTFKDHGGEYLVFYQWELAV